MGIGIMTVLSFTIAKKVTNNDKLWPFPPIMNNKRSQLTFLLVMNDKYVTILTILPVTNDIVSDKKGHNFMNDKKYEWWKRSQFYEWQKLLIHRVSLVQYYFLIFALFKKQEVKSSLLIHLESGIWRGRMYF